MLDIRLLGPLEARDGERTIEVRRQKLRALLAVLALDAGRVLSKDGLVDRLWGEHAPAGAVHALESYVSQLRKLLGGSAIQTRAPGYVLDVAPEQVDALRFERLIGDGQAEEALALLYGPPLSDVATEPFAAAEIARLEELELSAREQLVELRLEQGRHAEVVPELERLVVATPYRERLRALLMLALYRSGRQADALAAYRSAREALVDDLGIEPGAELQELERAILRQDESLCAPAAARAEPAPPATSRPVRKTVTILFAVLPETQRDPEAVDEAQRLARTVVERYDARLEQSLGGNVVARQHHVPAPGLALGGNGLNAAFHGAVLVDADVADALEVDPGDLRVRDRIPAGAVSLRPFDGVPPSTALEPGIARLLPGLHPVEEGLERAVQAADRGPLTAKGPAPVLLRIGGPDLL